MDAKNIIDIIEKFKPMSCWEDIGVTADIFKFVQPKAILELGVGGGGWILSIDNILPDNIAFVGYEDFEQNYGLNWAGNVEDLHNYFKNQTQNYNIKIKNENVKNLDTEYLKQLDIKFDVVRLDCLENPKDVDQLFFKILPFTSDNCIFFVDDIPPNICPGRFISYMDRVYDGILKPVWFGNKEGAWCKNTYNIYLLQNYIFQESSGKVRTTDDVNLVLYNLPYRVIRTSHGI